MAPTRVWRVSAIVLALWSCGGDPTGLPGALPSTQSATDTLALRAATARQIGVSADTLRFVALRQVDTLDAWLLDAQGARIPGVTPAIVVRDSSVASSRSAAPFAVTSLRTGTTTLELRSNGLVRQVAVIVDQQATTVEAKLAGRQGIVMAAIGSRVTLRCRALDRNGYEIPLAPFAVQSASGVVTGTSCSDLRVVRSGLDTLRVSTGGVATALAIAVAAPAVVSSPLGEAIALPALPAGVPWAPSARRNSHGQLEVYFGWVVGADNGDDGTYEDLHRIVSDDDGATFRDDGVVLQHNGMECSPTGFGFENVAIVPRHETAGWRMYVSGGQFNCYGWQVFSAVSTDERNWTLETGVRLGDGATSTSSAALPTPYWPTGEGMVIDQLPSGGWRMLLGAYEHLTPGEDKFQIVEWQSPDQLHWSYRRAALTTRQMPAAAQGTIYSPTIRQVAPGLWRMIFAGDNRFGEGWRGRLWTALSTDLEHWQLEGQLMGSDRASLFYASLVGDRLVFIRQNDGGARELAIATVSMP